MYKITEGKIIISKEDFHPEHTLLCGQIFSYEEKKDSYIVFTADKKAEIFEKNDYYEIITNSPGIFVKFFDLDTNYTEIKNRLLKYDILKKPIEFGYGIRILQNNKFEMLISFIISANNNIKRIQKIIDGIKRKCGKLLNGFYAFPTREELLQLTEKDFSNLGAGYRAKYLYKVLRQVNEDMLQEWSSLDTKSLRQKLIGLSGVGPKVADCILLFGYNRQDVFPVDTWIEQMYNQYIDAEEHNREKIRKNFTEMFGEYSGYAQQYLFYYQRSAKKE